MVKNMDDSVMELVRSIVSNNETILRNEGFSFISQNEFDRRFLAGESFEVAEYTRKAPRSILKSLFGKSNSESPEDIKRQKEKEFETQIKIAKYPFLNNINYINFLRECYSKGFKEYINVLDTGSQEAIDEALKDKYSVQKVSVLANKYDISCTEETIVSVIRKAFSINSDSYYERRMIEFLALGPEYEKIVKEANKYVKLFGLSKRKEMLNDLINSTQAKINNIQKTAASYVINNSEKKVNPYAMGGAAEGLGGAAAGLVAYQNAVIDNAKADIHNANVQKNAIKMGAEALLALGDDFKMFSIWKEEYSNIDYLYFEDDPEAFNKLDIGLAEVFENDYRRISVKIEVSLKEEIQLNEKARGVVDGTIIADVFSQEGNKIDSVFLTIPWDGITPVVSTLIGFSTEEYKRNVNYSVSIRPYKLWIVESSSIYDIVVPKEYRRSQKETEPKVNELVSNKTKNIDFKDFSEEERKIISELTNSMKFLKIYEFDKMVGLSSSLESLNKTKRKKVLDALANKKVLLMQKFGNDRFYSLYEGNTDKTKDKYLKEGWFEKYFVTKSILLALSDGTVKQEHEISKEVKRLCGNVPLYWDYNLLCSNKIITETTTGIDKHNYTNQSFVLTKELTENEIEKISKKHLKASDMNDGSYISLEDAEKYKKILLDLFKDRKFLSDVEFYNFQEDNGFTEDKWDYVKWDMNQQGLLRWKAINGVLYYFDPKVISIDEIKELVS